MSAQVKKAGRIGTKIVAAFLFLVLVMFNVQIGMYDGESGDISLFGLKLSLFIPSIAASQWWFSCETWPYCGGTINCYQGNYLYDCWIYCPHDGDGGSGSAFHCSSP